MDVTLEKGIRELSPSEMAEHREHVHSEARERISGIGGALRVSLNNMAVGSLREYIALSRHQLEMSEYVNVHTDSSEDPDDLWIQKIDWPTGQYHPFRMATRPVEQDEKALPPAWAVEQLRDVMWRVRAVGSVLGRSGKHLVATDADGITELSNHQCEIAEFLRTGKFKKVPRRRKARYLGSDGTQSAETAQRVRELGEALKEYQGRIEIKTVREFIALSKHQCELAGMVIASEREMQGNPVFEVVGYEEAYPNAVGRSDENNAGWVKAGTARYEQAGTQHSIDPCRQGDKGTVGLRSALGTSLLALSRSRQPNLHSASTFLGHAKVSKESPDPACCGAGSSGNGACIKSSQFEAVRLDPDKTHDLPSVPFLPGGNIPVPMDGRWVRVDTPDGPLAIRSISPPEPEYYVDDHASGVAGDEYDWDEDWDEDP